MKQTTKSSQKSRKIQCTASSYIIFQAAIIKQMKHYNKTNEMHNT